jgi:formate hydrogenlyase subunit 7
MFKLLNYLLSTGVSTVKSFPLAPPDDWRGMPALTDVECGSGCNSCAAVCPTEAITMLGAADRPDMDRTELDPAEVEHPEAEHPTVAHPEATRPEVALDLGACIQCGLCFAECPTGTIVENKTFRVAATSREDLVLVKDRARVPEILQKDSTVSRKSLDATNTPDNKIFSNSLHVRSVSTGCSACDAEIGAVYNPIYDVERFGCHLVASPRYADALLITGPVSKAMHNPLERCYGAMAEPRIVIAVGTCAISGGVHKGGYAGANGADVVLPVNVYIPGCPPHPWSIIHGVLVAMGKMEPFKPAILKKEEVTATHFTTSHS